MKFQGGLVVGNRKYETCMHENACMKKANDEGIVMELSQKREPRKKKKEEGL